MYWMETIWKRFVDFLKSKIFNKYKNHLIILDNVGSHTNNYVKEAIKNSDNKYLYSIPYTPETNLIENMFNQLEYYLKLNKKVLKFNEIEKEIKNAFTKIKKKSIIKTTFCRHMIRNSLNY